MKVRDVAQKLNLFGFDVDWREKSLRDTLEFNGYNIIDDEYVDKEYSDIKGYLDVELDEK